jgi:MFS family permease
VIADIMRGTGRYNLALGAIATVQGIGASLSGLAAGEIVDHCGYSAAFLTLGAAALVAVIVFFLQMPETAGNYRTGNGIAEVLSTVSGRSQRALIDTKQVEDQRLIFAFGRVQNRKLRGRSKLFIEIPACRSCFV